MTSSTPCRESARLTFVHQALADAGIGLTPASADASFRSYWRARRVPGSAGENIPPPAGAGHARDCGTRLSNTVAGMARSYIVMDAPPDRENLDPWLAVNARLRAAGLNAPEVFAVDREQGFVLMHDLGDRLYLSELDQASVATLYPQALDALFTMQADIDPAGLPNYDETRLVEELELMPAWFLRRHLGFTPGCAQWDTIGSAFQALVENAREQPQGFVHRDYHSRNLLVVQGHSPGIIDFQDAVRGPITYDLVSLLRDCYIAWPDDRVYVWTEDFRKRLAAAGRVAVDGARFRRWFDLMGVQRHLKVLGIFCRLYYRDGKAGYLGDLPRVWRYTREVGSEYDAIGPLIELIERALAGRDITLPNDASPAPGSQP